MYVILLRVSLIYQGIQEGLKCDFTMEIYEFFQNEGRILNLMEGSKIRLFIDSL